jgi:hypothetical protein
VLWIARLSWIVLAFTSANALDHALGDTSTPVRVVVALLAWTLWGATLLGLLAPRPWGFTVARIACTAAVATALISTGFAAATATVPAVAVACVAAVCVCSARVAHACADGVAYGYEHRFPLRPPFALLIGGIPLAAAIVVAGAATGPLLLAARAWIAGVLASVVGLPVAWLTVRALHGLSVRWLVVVPAGFVIVDRLTLADPVLLPTEQVTSIDAAPVARPDGAVDLRLGTAFGSLLVTTREPGEIARRTGRATTTPTNTAAVIVAPVRPSWFRRALADRSTEPAH